MLHKLLCRIGFHDWKLWNDWGFDFSGRRWRVQEWKCLRCNKFTKREPRHYMPASRWEDCQ